MLCSTIVLQPPHLTASAFSFQYEKASSAHGSLICVIINQWLGFPDIHLKGL